MVIIPVESVLIELYHDLRNLHIGLLGSHQVRLLRPLPLDQEEEFSRLVGGSDDLLRF